MYEFRTELLETSIKWGFNDSANPQDLARLDAFIMQRQNEGWELVTYSYMANVNGVKGAFAVTFKRKR